MYFRQFLIFPQINTDLKCLKILKTFQRNIEKVIWKIFNRNHLGSRKVLLFLKISFLTQIVHSRFLVPRAGMFFVKFGVQAGEKGTGQDFHMR